MTSAGRAAVIQTADGVILAQSVPSNDRFKFQRVYPTKDLFADVTGFFAFTFGSDGVERTYNDVLAGRTDSAARASPGTRSSRTRSSLPTSRSASARTRSRWRGDALGDRQGSVVALDPRDGAILAAVELPVLRPQPARDPRLRGRRRRAPGVARRSRESRSCPRTYRERYFPGSTFKVVTSSAGLQSGQVTPTSPCIPSATSYTPPLTTKPDRELRRRGLRWHALRDLARSRATARSRRWASTSVPR